ncbi:MAG: hypothetical protein F4X44_13825 [Gammaproteobacteria bacterium]|nr:hypothetical protein [Gammaproteobacteria bacterium]MYD81677.1 hypothetical protein [Gammaproteobacteria bacterium]
MSFDNKGTLRKRFELKRICRVVLTAPLVVLVWWCIYGIELSPDFGYPTPADFFVSLLLLSLA